MRVKARLKRYYPSITLGQLVYVNKNVKHPNRSDVYIVFREPELKINGHTCTYQRDPRGIWILKEDLNFINIQNDF